MSTFRVCRGTAGFTLVEVAIVLVIIGLILGGAFKGQSLIDSARVRTMGAELAGIETAWLAFSDRYRALPGDFAAADVRIDNDATPGNGNGRLDDASERAGVWQQLALAGFIHGSYDGSAASVGSADDLDCSASSCPSNPFNGYYKIAYGARAAGAASTVHEIFTGGQVPVSILSQLDARIDDGRATDGRFRVHRDYLSACTRRGEWDLASANTNCAGVLRN